jgi:hypothetical protein
MMRPQGVPDPDRPQLGLEAFAAQARESLSPRVALASTTGPPSSIVADLDDASDNTAGTSVLSKSWGGTVPLTVLSWQPECPSHFPDGSQPAIAHE